MLADKRAIRAEVFEEVAGILLAMTKEAKSEGRLNHERALRMATIKIGLLATTEREKVAT